MCHQKNKLGMSRMIGFLALLGLSSCAEDTLPQIDLIAGVPGEQGFVDNVDRLEAEFATPNDTVICPDGILISDEGNHRIRFLSADGIVSTLVGTGDSGNTGDGGPPAEATLGLPRGIVAMPECDIFYFSDAYNHVVRRVSIPDNTITTFAGDGTAGYEGDNGPATSAKLDQPRGIALDSQGNLFIADYGNLAVRRVSADGIITTYLDPDYFDDGPDDGPRAVATDSDDNLYFAHGNLVRRTAPGGLSTSLVAGTGESGYSGDGGPAWMAEIAAPRDLDVYDGEDGVRRLLIADTGNHVIRIVAFTDSGTLISTLAGGNGLGYSGDGGAATLAQFEWPGGVTFGSSHFVPGPSAIYVADTFNFVIRAIHYPPPPAPEPPPGPITAVITPVDIAFHSTALYILDQGAEQVVRRVTPDAAELEVYVPAAELNQPEGFDVDAGGNLFIADTFNHVIKRVDALTGEITIVAGTTGVAGSSGNGGSATSALLSFPRDVAVDAEGRLYIAHGFIVRMVDIDPESTISLFAGGGGTPNADGITATDAFMTGVRWVEADNAGNVYITSLDTDVVKVVQDGIIYDYAGNGFAGSGGDGGSRLTAQVNAPRGVTADAAGNVYIADTGNNKIRLVTESTINTFAGTGTAGSLGDEGPALEAQLDSPEAVAVDPSGNVYIADTDNGKVRVVDSSPERIIRTVIGP